MLLINHTDYLQVFNMRFRVKRKSVSSQTRSVLVRLHVEKHGKKEREGMEGGVGDEGGEIEKGEDGREEGKAVVTVRHLERRSVCRHAAPAAT